MTSAEMTSAEMTSAQPYGRTTGFDQQLTAMVLEQLSTLLVFPDFDETQENIKNLYTGPKWLGIVDDRMEEFLELDDNWNSYGAKRINEEIPPKALRLLLKIDSSDTPEPFVAPTPDGGIDIEWNTEDKLLSFKVRPDGMRYFFADRKTKQKDGAEISDSTDINELLKLMLANG